MKVNLMNFFSILFNVVTRTFLITYVACTELFQTKAEIANHVLSIFLH